jgi:Zn-dependent metalloprotease
MRRTRALAASLSATLVAGSLVAFAATTPASAAPAPDRDPADSFVAAHPAALRTGPHDTLVRTGVHSGTDGLRYVAYERTHRGLPVVGGDAVVMLDAAGAVVTAVTAQSSTVDVAVAPSVSPDAAVATSRAGLRTVDAAGTPTLAVLAWGTPTLVWDTVVAGRTATNDPSVRHVYVDAHTGGPSAHPAPARRSRCSTRPGAACAAAA